MSPLETRDLTVKHGATLSLEVGVEANTGALDAQGEPVYLPVALGDGTYDAHMQVRAKAGAPLLVEALSSGTDPRIVLSAGLIAIRIPPSVMAAGLPVGKFRYDVKVTRYAGLATEDVLYPVGGTIEVEPSFTVTPGV